LRIAFFGLPLAAVLLAADGHSIVYAAACRRGPGLRRLTRDIAPGNTWLRPAVDLPETYDRVRAAAPDLIVSWFWTRKLPAHLLDLAPTVGVHPSLLPRHRGPDPFFWAIDGGDEVTGVTAHRLEAEYDTGAILGQREVRIGAGWNAWELARRLDRPSLALLREVAAAFRAGRPPPAIAQDPAATTVAPAPDDEDLEMNWSWTAERLERRVRAAAPRPGTWTEIGDRRVTLVRVRPTSQFPRTLVPTEAAVRPDGVAVVRAADIALELLEGRDEDDGSLRLEDLARIVEAARPPA